MPQSGSYSTQGTRVTVNDFIKDPLLVPARMLRLLDNEWIMESILRKEGPAVGGVISFEESTPLFADEDPSIVAEGGEIPLVMGSDGLPRAAYTVKLGAGIEITRETQSRNKLSKVTRRMDQVANTFTRAWELRMKTALDAAVAATGKVFDATTGVVGAVGYNVWDDVTAPIRIQTMKTKLLVSQSVATTDPQQANSFLGLRPDVMIMSENNATRFIANNSVNDIYKNSPEVKNAPLFNGTLPRQFMNLFIMSSRFLSDADVYVLERKTVGGYSDEYAFATTPMYEDKPRQTHRADSTRRTAIFIDQPQAVAKIKVVRTTIQA